MCWNVRCNGICRCSCKTQLVLEISRTSRKCLRNCDTSRDVQYFLKIRNFENVWTCLKNKQQFPKTLSELIYLKHIYLLNLNNTSITTKINGIREINRDDVIDIAEGVKKEYTLDTIVFNLFSDEIHVKNLRDNEIQLLNANQKGYMDSTITNLF